MSLATSRNTDLQTRKHLVPEMTESEFYEVFNQLTEAEIYVDLEQNFNILQRLKYQDPDKPLFKESDKKPVEFVLFEVDTEKLNIYSSKGISELKNSFIIQNGNKVLLPVLKSFKNEFQLRLLSRPIGSLVGHKIMGHSSYFIPEQNGFPSMTLKTKRIAGSSNLARKSIEASDYITQYQSLLPEDLQNTHLKEPLALSLLGLGLPYTVIFREMSQTNEVKNRQTLPAFGLLGCELCMDLLARKSGLKSAFQWKKQILMPRLARMMAHYHFSLGLLPEAHTQNILLEVDFSTGELVNIHLRDHADSLVNPVPLIFKGIFDAKSAPQDLQLMNTYFLDVKTPEAKFQHLHSAMYVSQAIQGHVRGQSARNKMYLAFFQSYLQEVKTIIEGESLELDSLTKSILDIYEGVSFDTPFSLEKELGLKRGRNVMMFALLMRNIMTQVQDIQVQKLLENSQIAEKMYEAETLKIIIAAIEQHQVLFLDPSSRLELSPGYNIASTRLRQMAPTIDRVYYSWKNNWESLKLKWSKLKHTWKNRILRKPLEQNTLDKIQRQNDIYLMRQQKYEKNMFLAPLQYLVDRYSSRIDHLFWSAEHFLNQFDIVKIKMDSSEAFVIRSRQSNKVMAITPVKSHSSGPTSCNNFLK